MAESDNKRHIERVRLYAPITASVEEQRITVLDVSEAGARIEHPFPLSTGTSTQMVIDYNGGQVTVECEVVRCKLDKSIIGGTPSYTSGLRFVNPDDPSIDLLIELLHKVVTEDLPARERIVTRKKKAPARRANAKK